MTGEAFKEAFVEADGFRIRYLEGGIGPALVCLHGGGGLRLARRPRQRPAAARSEEKDRQRDEHDEHGARDAGDVHAQDGRPSAPRSPCRQPASPAGG